MGIETALVFAAVGSSLMGGISALNAGNAANKAAGIAAANAEANGQTQAAATRRKGNMFIGSQRAQFGAMGFDPLGNALDVLQNTAFENELEAQTQITNSKFESWNLRVQGKAAKKKGQMAFVQSIGNAASSALTGGMGAGGFTGSANVGASYGSQSGAIMGMMGV